MTFTAHDVVFLNYLGLIPDKLKKGWAKAAGGHDPTVQAGEIVRSGARNKIFYTLLAFLIPFTILVMFLNYEYKTSYLFGAAVLTVMHGTFLCLAVGAFFDLRKASRAFETSGGFGHALYELHESAPGILRSGSDPKMVTDTYRSAMMRYGAEVVRTAELPEGATAISVINAKFNLGLRFMLHSSVKPGWKQYLPKKELVPAKEPLAA